MLYGVRGTRAVFFVFYSPLLTPPPSLSRLPGGESKDAELPRLSAARCQARNFHPSVFVYGEDSCVRDVRVSPRVRIVWCLHAARAPGKRPRSLAPPSETPDTSPTVRVFAHTDLKHLHTHPNTVSLGRNCVAPLCCVLACSPADRRRRKKKKS